MKTEEARKLMAENFVEISEEEYFTMYKQGEIMMECVDGYLYFKPKKKFPIVFEDDSRVVEIRGDGSITITDLSNHDQIIFCDSLDLLYKAVEKSKELRK